QPERAAHRAGHDGRRHRGLRDQLPAHPAAVPVPRAVRRSVRGAADRPAVGVGQRAGQGQRRDSGDPHEGSARGGAAARVPLRARAVGHSSAGEHRGDLLDSPVAGQAAEGTRRDRQAAQQVTRPGPRDWDIFKLASPRWPGCDDGRFAGVGLLDTLLGRTKPVPPNLDALFALPSAAITLQAATDYTPTGTGSVCFRAAEGKVFADIEKDVRDLLSMGKDKTPVTLSADSYGFTWLVATHPADDVEGLVTDLHAVNSSLADAGFGPQLLCTILSFRDSGGKPL